MSGERQRWDSTVKNGIALKYAMESNGHTGIVWDTAGGHGRGTCQHGCTAILIAGSHAYGTGLSRCPGNTEEEG